MHGGWRPRLFLAVLAGTQEDMESGQREIELLHLRGGAASPQSLPSGPVRTGGAASTRTPESVSPRSACTPWGAHPIRFTSWLTPTVPHDGWVQTLVLSGLLTHPP